MRSRSFNHTLGCFATTLCYCCFVAKQIMHAFYHLSVVLLRTYWALALCGLQVNVLRHFFLLRCLFCTRCMHRKSIYGLDGERTICARCLCVRVYVQSKPWQDRDSNDMCVEALFFRFFFSATESNVCVYVVIACVWKGIWFSIRIFFFRMCFSVSDLHFLRSLKPLQIACALFSLMYVYVCLIMDGCLKFFGGVRGMERETWRRWHDGMNGGERKQQIVEK